LEFKTFYKTQGEVAEIIIKLVDSYWNEEKNEEYIFQLVKKIAQNNEHLLYKDSEFTAAVKQKCGKRRLELISKIVKTTK
jgi:uncharacterized protein (TIGR04540 family)